LLATLVTAARIDQRMGMSQLRTPSAPQHTNLGLAQQLSQDRKSTVDLVCDVGLDLVLGWTCRDKTHRVTVSVEFTLHMAMFPGAHGWT
jgi:hypothetical protein